MDTSTWGRAAVLLFLLGATGGSALDAFYVHQGLKRYSTAVVAGPTLFGLPWWVPLLTGSAAVAIGLSHPLLDPLLAHLRTTRRLSTSIAALGWLCLAYLLGAIPLAPLARCGLLGLLYLNFWLLAGRSWQNLIFSAVVAITGTLIEMILVNAGIFSFPQNAELLGVPAWLPWLYAYASLALGDLGRALISLQRGG
ncbi:hypothetical protein [Thermogemmatispora tikiterensis]|uniref:Uncharacterized protein n=1 Tax=Thermogemmatispora tikiterensis TaxID=1825093 RepID=A0A328VMV0_9CHLR|nr:hypothetical protein [Thermogemmatispora tikiterensis]RAQ95465.1 hypothetical protein A4R35_07950 [Thermogemmatispora tikiterensis]